MTAPKTPAASELSEWPDVWVAIDKDGRIAKTWLDADSMPLADLWGLSARRYAPYVAARQAPEVAPVARAPEQQAPIGEYMRGFVAGAARMRERSLGEAASACSAEQTDKADDEWNNACSACRDHILSLYAAPVAPEQQTAPEVAAAIERVREFASHYAMRPADRALLSLVCAAASRGQALLRNPITGDLPIGPPNPHVNKPRGSA